MKPRIDPSTRTLLEPAPTLPTPGPLPASPGRGFVELCARTSFSGVTIEGYGTVGGRSVHDARAAWPGAGLPEVVTRAAVFGQDTVAIADIDTVAGVVRAHDRGKELGVGVIPGCELLLDEGSLVLLPMDARGWANLCAILTIAKDGTRERGVQKDDVEHRLQTVIDHASSLQAIAGLEHYFQSRRPSMTLNTTTSCSSSERIDHDVVAPCDNELAGPGDDAYTTECRVDLKMLGDGEEPCSHSLGLLEGLKRSAQRDDILE